MGVTGDRRRTERGWKKRKDEMHLRRKPYFSNWGRLEAHHPSSLLGNPLAWDTPSFRDQIEVGEPHLGLPRDLLLSLGHETRK